MLLFVGASDSDFVFCNSLHLVGLVLDGLLLHLHRLLTILLLVELGLTLTVDWLTLDRLAHLGTILLLHCHLLLHLRVDITLLTLILLILVFASANRSVEERKAAAVALDAPKNGLDGTKGSQDAGISLIRVGVIERRSEFPNILNISPSIKAAIVLDGGDICAAPDAERIETHAERHRESATVAASAAEIANRGPVARLEVETSDGHDDEVDGRDDENCRVESEGA